MTTNPLDQQWQDRLVDNHSLRENDHRTPFQRDRARILHSTAFRRLQGKKQIHTIGENDFFRTRLTHSLETAQIGSSLVARLALPSVLPDSTFKALLPSDALIESLCLAHDIGHPPFGHGGEMALNFMMYQNGGFEGNAQTFRILSKLEPYTEQAGMNLTRRTLLGVMKYPILIPHPTETVETEIAHAQKQPYINMEDWAVQKGIYLDDKDRFDWVLEPLSTEDKAHFTKMVPKNRGIYASQYKSLDCSIMELADDISYAVHDLEDAIVLGMVNLTQWQEALTMFKACRSPWIDENIEKLSQQLFSDQHYLRKEAIGAWVNYFIRYVEWKELPEFTSPLLRYNASLPKEVQQVLGVLKSFVSTHVIKNVHTQRVEYKGQRILRELFQTIIANSKRLLPQNTLQRWKKAEETGKHRIICDYIAGMSDNYALKIYQQL